MKDIKKLRKTLAKYDIRGEIMRNDELAGELMTDLLKIFDKDDPETKEVVDVISTLIKITDVYEENPEGGKPTPTPITVLKKQKLEKYLKLL